MNESVLSAIEQKLPGIRMLCPNMDMISEVVAFDEAYKEVYL